MSTVLYWMWRYSDWGRWGWWLLCRPAPTTLAYSLDLEQQVKRQERTLEMMEYRLLFLTRQLCPPPATTPGLPPEPHDTDDLEYEIV